MDGTMAYAADVEEGARYCKSKLHAGAVDA